MELKRTLGSFSSGKAENLQNWSGLSRVTEMVSCWAEMQYQLSCWSFSILPAYLIGKTLAHPSGAVVKNPPAKAGDARGSDSIPGLGKSPGGGNGNPLQYSCLKNPMDRGAWQAIVHGVAKSWTQLSDWTHTQRSGKLLPYRKKVAVEVMEVLSTLLQQSFHNIHTQ